MSPGVEFERPVAAKDCDESPGSPAFWRMRRWSHRAQYVVLATALAVGIAAAIAADPEPPAHNMDGHAGGSMSGHDMSHQVDGMSGASMTEGDMTEGAPQAKHASNKPLGVARGIHPGRVTWVRDPAALDWDGVSEGTTEGYWNGHTDQAAINRMVSRSLQELTGASSDAAAWDALFRHFNKTHGDGDVGYKAGEKINIKINLTTTSSDLGNRIAADGTQLTDKEFVGPSLELTHALLAQLVSVVGVDQADITMGDTTGTVPNYYYDYLTKPFSVDELARTIRRVLDQKAN